MRVLVGLPPTDHQLAPVSLFSIREAYMRDELDNDNGDRLFSPLVCCSGYRTTWTSPRGTEGDSVLFHVQAHDLWCSAGQVLLDARCTL
jgi:hypothetical protein